MWPVKCRARIGQLSASDAAPLLVADVAQAGRILQAQQIEQAENEVGVAVRVGSVFQQGQFRFVAQNLVQHVGGVALDGRDDLAAVLSVVVGRVGVKRHALAVAEVARQGLGIAHGPADGKPLHIGRGQAVPASMPGQPLVVLLVDHPHGGSL